MKVSAIAFWLVGAAVVGIFFVSVRLDGSEWGGTDPADLYYNLLVRGFRAGQLSLARAAPAGLASLPDPYDPAANAPYRAAPFFLQDASFFHGKLYLYFGITPALVLFWPWVELTGHYLPHKYAVAIFCSAGFLIGAGLLRAWWRRYFADGELRVGGGVAAACALALGLAASTLLMLQRPGICEVPISCAYCFTMAALAALWCAVHRPEARGRWLAAASLAYGLAVGSRPSALFGAAILFLPVWLCLRETGRPSWRLVGAAVLPMALCGLGLMIYNALRFGSPFDFGHAYQLSDIGRAPGFKFGYIAYNLRLYFLAPTYWNRFFPFAQGIRLPPLPSGYYPPEGVFGLLPNIPLVALALMAPLGLRGRAAGDQIRLGGFLAAIAVLFLLVLAPLLCYFAACGRYEAEFLPPLVLLAGAGILGLERWVASRYSWRPIVRTVWLALLAFSVAFNLLASCGRYAGERYAEGLRLEEAGRWPEAAAKFQDALRANPGFAQAHYLLGNALDAGGRQAEALTEYQVAARLDPGDPQMHNNLGIALARLRRLPEAAKEFEAAVRLRPDFAEGHANLGNAFLLLGRLPEAIGHYEAALRLTPADGALRARLAAARQALANQR